MRIYLVVLGLLLAGCSPKVYGIKVELYLKGKEDSTIRYLGQHSKCEGSDISSGFSDIKKGLPITVRNEEQKIIGIDVLTQGRVSEIDYEKSCKISGFVSKLPDAKFYTIELKGRGAVTFSKQELVKDQWKVEFSLN